jgi:hypothetical protein
MQASGIVLQGKDLLSSEAASMRLDGLVTG